MHRMITAKITATKGSIGTMALTTGIFPMDAATSRQMPTGGVINPIANVMTATTP